MLDGTRQWFRRNRTNFAVSAGLLGAGYLAGQYVLSKFGEARQRMSDDRIARENLRRRFEQNQQDCTFTVLAILPTATDEILEALPVESTLNALQQKKAERLAKSIGASDAASSDFQSTTAPSVTDDDGRSLKSSSESYIHASQITEGQGSIEGVGQNAAPPQPKKSRAQLWNEVKISSITRAFTLIYTLALLTLLTRIQLNLLGRRNYLASVVALASTAGKRPERTISLENHDDDGFEHAYGNDFETNRMYLSFSWWLLHKGCKDIMNKVNEAVKAVFDPVSVREDLTLEKLSELVLEVRKKVEGSTDEDRRTNKWLHFLLPPRDQEDYVLRESGMTTAENTSPPTSALLRRLLDETSDLIDSPAFTHVLTVILDSGFSLLIDNKMATLAYKVPPTSSSNARITDLSGLEAKSRLANTLAIFCRQAHSIGTGGANEYLAAMETVRDLEAFAAVVYSSNFDFEAAEAAIPTESQENSLGSRSQPPTTRTSAFITDQTPRASYIGEASQMGSQSEFDAAWEKAIAREEGRLQ